MEQQASPRVQLLDFDALSSAPGAPRGLAGTWTDWHYTCKFLWDEPEVRGERAARGRVGFQGWKVARVWGRSGSEQDRNQGGLGLGSRLRLRLGSRSGLGLGVGTGLRLGSKEGLISGKVLKVG